MEEHKVDTFLYKLSGDEKIDLVKILLSLAFEREEEFKENNYMGGSASGF